MFKKFGLLLAALLLLASPAQALNRGTTLSTEGVGIGIINDNNSLLLGYPAPNYTVWNANGKSPTIQVQNTTEQATLSLWNFNSAGTLPVLEMGKSGGSTQGSHGCTDTSFGQINFYGDDGAQRIISARIQGSLAAACSSGSVPGKITIYTTPASSTTPVIRFQIDQNGAVTVNGDGSIPGFAGSVFPNLAVTGITSNASSMGVHRSSNDTSGSVVFLGKSRGTTNVSHGAVQAGDVIGRISGQGDDGTNLLNVGEMAVEAEGSISTGIVPGVLKLKTQNASGSLTTAVTINSSQLATFAGGISSTNITFTGSTVPTNGFYLPASNVIGWATNGSVRGIFDSTGDLIVGSSSAYIPGFNGGNIFPKIISESGATSASVGAVRWSADASGGYMVIGKTRGTTIGTPAGINTGDTLGTFSAQGYEGTSGTWLPGAEIQINAEGTISSGVVPGNLKVRTSNASGTLTTALTIDSSQLATFAGTNGISTTNINFSGSTVPANGFYLPASNNIGFATNSAVRGIMDASGDLILSNTNSAYIPGFSNGASFPRINSYSTDAKAAISAVRWSNDANGPQFYLGKTRGTTIGTPATINTGDTLGTIGGQGYEGTSATWREASAIQFNAEGTLSSGVVPGNIIMRTTNSAGTATTALTIDSAQLATFAKGVKGNGFISNGTKFTLTGCSAGTTVGGATSGQFASGTTGTCTVVITMNGATGMTAPNGWSCWANDITTPADLINQTASSTTTATLSGTTVSGDTINFGCMAY